LNENNLINLFEQQYISYQALGLPINDPFLEVLERLNLSAGIEIVRLERKGFRATQFVGVIQAGNRLIQILPKIDYSPDGNSDAPVGSRHHNLATNSAAKNFLYLLAYTHNLNLHSQTLSTLRTSHGTWLELLTRLFVVELMTQLQQGFHEDYVRREEMLPYIRGRWNISRQFTRQPNLIKGLDVSFDDYSPDTQLNRILRYTIEHLQMVTRDSQNRNMLADLDSWMMPVRTKIQIFVDELDRIQFTRLNERYKPVFQLARLFIEGQTVQLIAGGQRAYAFVFDMDRLFETFVGKLLQTKHQQILPEAWKDYQIELQGSKSKLHLIYPPVPDDKPMFYLKPDILLWYLGTPKLIIDTKNKALPLNLPYREIAEGDVYQVLTYASRFQCPDILLLYPHTLGANQATPYCLSIEGAPIRLFVTSLDLHQPLERMNRLIQEFHNILDYIHTQEVTILEETWPV